MLSSKNKVGFWFHRAAEGQFGIGCNVMENEESQVNNENSLVSGLILSHLFAQVANVIVDIYSFAFNL